MKTRLYRHYKNKTYKFLGLARHSETLEQMALYETLYQNDLGQTWVRPKDLFFGKINIDNQSVDRFAQVDLRVEESTSLNKDNLKIIQQICRACGTDADDVKYDDVVFLQIVFDANNPVAFKLGYAEDPNVFVSKMTAVTPDYRHLGIASALSEQQQTWCHKNKFSKIRSYLFNRNTQMLRLNLKLGFHIVHVDSENQIFLEKNI